MTQLQLDISDEMAAWIQREAKEMSLSVSEYVAQMLQKARKNKKAKVEKADLDEVKTVEELAKENGWPESFLALYGSGKDDPIEHPDQNEYSLKDIVL
ncbi:MAG: hypothetical protein DCF25_18825 [Leptolyngbya foveolarum]|jgi:hypothetical protein|uniref:Uncharacterized protein n=1 Tax=Leptolyngbya foveolarum TaxID=47253 RepID=A0A2W4TS09_9CYAN|nr:MAG: hypothetical protein DCF25_18825 [Leptolyngbya foveolarum]